MLITALFLIDIRWKKYKLPLVEKCLINFWSIQTLESYAIVKNYHPIYLIQSSRRKEGGTSKKKKQYIEGIQL